MNCTFKKIEGRRSHHKIKDRRPGASDLSEGSSPLFQALAKK
ncbi:MAG: hypothetical protein OP8BY_0342 [Candidatus Saccharicenans subterraneus]|uniref:Uncharacterized protein n=1 Tax=Candidatus Saccharicenans subterraneus TaxID=2508984 RepID=A0A3E2BLB2_9BACT|nr:MAG: hypothetical protein OP8BY_0342 [Candidatus Saccharicenans subterraneum]